VIRNMWRAEQEHDVIGIFYCVQVWQQEGRRKALVLSTIMSRAGCPGRELSNACGNMGGS